MMSIRDRLERAPDPISLREAWQTLRELGIVANAQASTVNAWRQVVLNKAETWMHRCPTQAIWVYNTLFTVFIDDIVRNWFLHTALRLQKYALRTQYPAKEIR